MEAPIRPKKTIKTIAKTKTACRNRIRQRAPATGNEVTLGYAEDQALAEAARCIQCKNPGCTAGCPVAINIPGFIQAVETTTSAKPTTSWPLTTCCPPFAAGVCPQETPMRSPVHRRQEAGASGHRPAWNASSETWRSRTDGRWPLRSSETATRPAMIGSGPASITWRSGPGSRRCRCHHLRGATHGGGVLKYGIPEFRLPKKLIDRELEALQGLGVKVVTNAIIGRLFTIPHRSCRKWIRNRVHRRRGQAFPTSWAFRAKGSTASSRPTIPDAREPDARLPAPANRHADGHGQESGGDWCGPTPRWTPAASPFEWAPKMCTVCTVVPRRKARRAPREVHHAEEEGVKFTGSRRRCAYWRRTRLVRAMECIRIGTGRAGCVGPAARQCPCQASRFLFEVDTIVYAYLGPSAPQSDPGANPRRVEAEPKPVYIDVSPETQMTRHPRCLCPAATS